MKYKCSAGERYMYYWWSFKVLRTKYKCSTNVVKASAGASRLQTCTCSPTGMPLWHQVCKGIMGSVRCRVGLWIPGQDETVLFRNSLKNFRIFQEFQAGKLKILNSNVGFTFWITQPNRTETATSETHTQFSPYSSGCLPSTAAPPAGNSGNCPSEGTLTVLRRHRALDESAGLSWASLAAWGKQVQNASC